MDFQSMTLAGLMAIGAVNVVTMFKANIDSRVKFIISLVVAFTALYIPEQIGNDVLNKLRDAIQIAFASSGAYKLATKAGISIAETK